MRFEAESDDRTRITTNISWYDETTQTLWKYHPTQYRSDRTLAGKPNDEFKGQRDHRVTASREIDAHNTAKIIVYGNVRTELVYPGPGRQRTLSRPVKTFCASSIVSASCRNTIQISLFGLDQQITSGVRYHAERLTDITGIGTAGSKISHTTNNADLESVAYAVPMHGDRRFG